MKLFIKAYYVKPVVINLFIVLFDFLNVLCWRRGVVASVVRCMNEVTVHWARLVLGWVTVFGRVYHHGV